MLCPVCKQSTFRLIFAGNVMACARCRGLSEAGGPKIAGSLTRNSFRIREQQRRFEGDFITPHVYDKVTKQMKPNEDFVKRYPNKLGDYFKQSELEAAGYSKIGKVYEAQAKEKAAHKAEAGKVTFKPKGA